MTKRRLLAAEIFRKMSGATSSRGHTALYILRLGYIFLVVDFTIKPLITFSATLCECWSDIRE